MAPNRNKGVFQPKTQRETPTRFRCKVGGEWKDLSAFSQNQQKLIDRDGKIDAAHSGMTCRDHTSKGRVELRCNLCGLIKSKDQFSKRSIKNEDYTCMRCTAWTETQEPSVTPAPLETGHISVEEENWDGFQNGNFVDSADFFGENGLGQGPITSGGSGYMDNNHRYGQGGGRSGRDQCQNDTASVSGDSVNSSACLPPHLAGRAQASCVGAKSLSSVASTLGDTPKKGLPPHLAGRNTLVERLNPTPTASIATTVQEEKKSRQIPFNAWGSAGRQYQDYKDPTEGSSISSKASVTSGSRNTTCSIENDPNVIGDWDVTGQSEPALENRSQSQWPKSGCARIPESELKKQPILTHVKARHVDPDIDRQRRMLYCDSDDSDY
ncbi:hypothetical protein BGZ63DRAFT_417124 [Mariannaea sp. PMI_226]|nr:hypothetical protein BGZ63DRAFT_417124 [Mariannaea sp. PMI_226]